MEKKHTAKEMQDYITAREGLVLVMSWCTDIRYHATSKQDIELVDFYMTGLARLSDSLRIGAKEVQEVNTKYGTLIKNDKLTMDFIRDEYRKLRPFVKDTLFDKNGQPVMGFDRSAIIGQSAAMPASQPLYA
jgi:hypothetical protein